MYQHAGASRTFKFIGMTNTERQVPARASEVKEYGTAINLYYCKSWFVHKVLPFTSRTQHPKDL